VGYTCVPILVFLGLSVLDLGQMYASDIRQTSDSIIAVTEAYYERRHNKCQTVLSCSLAAKVSQQHHF